MAQRTYSNPMQWIVVLDLLAVLLLAFSCGGDKSPSPTSPSPTPPAGGGSEPAATLTITASGVSPTRVTIPEGGRVLVINNDSAVHWVASDPHPTHENCPELNSIGVLQPGDRRTSGNLVTRQSCGFHDHDNPGTRSLQGTVVIQ